MKKQWDFDFDLVFEQKGDPTCSGWAFPCDETGTVKDQGDTPCLMVANDAYAAGTHRRFVRRTSYLNGEIVGVRSMPI